MHTRVETGTSLSVSSEKEKQERKKERQKGQQCTNYSSPVMPPFNWHIVM